jgi:hypothetical protein
VDEAKSSPHPRSWRLLVAGSVCWIISGLDLRKPLHAGGMDFGNAVFERGALNLIFDLAIPQNPFKSDELSFQERLGEPREIPKVSRMLNPYAITYARPLKTQRLRRIPSAGRH